MRMRDIGHYVLSDQTVGISVAERAGDEGILRCVRVRVAVAQECLGAFGEVAVDAAVELLPVVRIRNVGDEVVGQSRLIGQRNVEAEGRSRADSAKRVGMVLFGNAVRFRPAAVPVAG